MNGLNTGGFRGNVIMSEPRIDTNAILAGNPLEEYKQGYSLGEYLGEAPTRKKLTDLSIAEKQANIDYMRDVKGPLANMQAEYRMGMLGAAQEKNALAGQNLELKRLATEADSKVKETVAALNEAKAEQVRALQKRDQQENEDWQKANMLASEAYPLARYGEEDPDAKVKNAELDKMWAGMSTADRIEAVGGITSENVMRYIQRIDSLAQEAKIAKERLDSAMALQKERGAQRTGQIAQQGDEARKTAETKAKAMVSAFNEQFAKKDEPAKQPAQQPQPAAQPDSAPAPDSGEPVFIKPENTFTSREAVAKALAEGRITKGEWILFDGKRRQIAK